MRKHLTELGVKALKPVPGKQIKVWDGAIKGFGVRINDRSKTWFVMYGKNRRFKALGNHPDMSLQDARIEAKKHLATPQAPRPTLAASDLFDRFLGETSANKAPRTRYEEKRMINGYFKPILGKMRVAEITDRDIARCLDPIKAPSERLHAFRCVRAMFRWATRPPHRFILHSPLEGFLAPSSDKERSRVLNDRELAAIWKAAEGQFGTMNKLLILWGLRKTELATMEWSWFDGDTFTVPEERTKNGHALTLPILPLARSILETIPKQGKYLFPSRYDPDKHIHDGSWGKLKLVMDKSAGVSNYVTHDLRRTLATGLQRLGVRLEVTEAVLNHVSGSRSGVVGIYQRYQWTDEIKEALRKWEAHVGALCPASDTNYGSPEPATPSQAL